MSAHWRNILCDDAAPDDEMDRIDEIVGDVKDVSDAARHDMGGDEIRRDVGGNMRSSQA